MGFHPRQAQSHVFFQIILLPAIFILRRDVPFQAYYGPVGRQDYSQAGQRSVDGCPATAEHLIELQLAVAPLIDHDHSHALHVYSRAPRTGCKQPLAATIFIFLLLYLYTKQLMLDIEEDAEISAAVESDSIPFHLADVHSRV